MQKQRDTDLEAPEVHAHHHGSHSGHCWYDSEMPGPSPWMAVRSVPFRVAEFGPSNEHCLPEEEFGNPLLLAAVLLSCKLKMLETLSSLLSHQSSGGDRIAFC